MPVNITFQGPSYASGNEPAVERAELSFEFAGFDLDFSELTVYTNTDDGMNHSLAQRAQYTNENGDKCGDIGWRINPSDELLAAVTPDVLAALVPASGLIYGRVIVTAGGFAVDGDTPVLSRWDKLAERIDDLELSVEALEDQNTDNRLDTLESDSADHARQIDSLSDRVNDLESD